MVARICTNRSTTQSLDFCIQKLKPTIYILHPFKTIELLQLFRSIWQKIKDDFCGTKVPKPCDYLSHCQYSASAGSIQQRLQAFRSIMSSIECDVWFGALRSWLVRRTNTELSMSNHAYLEHKRHDRVVDVTSAATRCKARNTEEEIIWSHFDAHSKATSYTHLCDLR